MDKDLRFLRFNSAEDFSVQCQFKQWLDLKIFSHDYHMAWFNIQIRTHKCQFILAIFPKQHEYKRRKLQVLCMKTHLSKIDFLSEKFLLITKKMHISNSVYSLCHLPCQHLCHLPKLLNLSTNTSHPPSTMSCCDISIIFWYTYWGVFLHSKNSYCCKEHQLSRMES